MAANPLLTNQYDINGTKAEVRFKIIRPTDIQRAICKMKSSYGFSLNGIANSFIKIALVAYQPHRANSLTFNYDRNIPRKLENSTCSSVYKSEPKDDKSN